MDPSYASVDSITLFHCFDTLVMRPKSLTSTNKSVQFCKVNKPSKFSNIIVSTSFDEITLSASII